MKNLKALRWSKSLVAETPFRSYRVFSDINNKFSVFYESELGEPATGFSSVEDAKKWAEHTHYSGEMGALVIDDSLVRIEKWFATAKPEPSLTDLSVQIGCHIEEFIEFLEALGFNQKTIPTLNVIAESFKNKDPHFIDKLRVLTYEQCVEITDAIADGNVTGTGVLYMLGGIDILGAQNEVIRSNDSKFVDGKAIMDGRGKIAKPASYSPPNLEPFIERH